MTSSRIDNAGSVAHGDGHWLASGHYVLLLTPAGTGLSAFDDCLLTVFRADPAEAPGGFAIYLRDLETRQYWTACGQLSPCPRGRREAMSACDSGAQRVCTKSFENAG